MDSKNFSQGYYTNVKVNSDLAQGERILKRVKEKQNRPIKSGLEGAIWPILNFV
jgi:hypothetical protein